MTTKTVTLHGGPLDGQTASTDRHAVTIDDQLYVTNGRDDGSYFVHALSALDLLTRQQRRRERKEVGRYLRSASDAMQRGEKPQHPSKALPNIPPWRCNVWIQVLAGN